MSAPGPGVLHRNPTAAGAGLCCVRKVSRAPGGVQAASGDSLVRDSKPPSHPTHTTAGTMEFPSHTWNQLEPAPKAPPGESFLFFLSAYREFLSAETALAYFGPCSQVQ